MPRDAKAEAGAGRSGNTNSPPLVFGASVRAPVVPHECLSGVNRGDGQTPDRVAQGSCSFRQAGLRLRVSRSRRDRPADARASRAAHWPTARRRVIGIEPPRLPSTSPGNSAQCLSTFCIDDFCFDSACAGSSQSCAIPGLEGNGLFSRHPSLGGRHIGPAPNNFNIGVSKTPESRVSRNFLETSPRARVLTSALWCARAADERGAAKDNQDAEAKQQGERRCRRRRGHRLADPAEAIAGGALTRGHAAAAVRDRGVGRRQRGGDRRCHRR